MLVLTAGVKSRGSLVAGKTLELPAFLVVAWCASCNRGVLKFSAVIRTIVAEATIYFLAMVAVQYTSSCLTF